MKLRIKLFLSSASTVFIFLVFIAGLFVFATAIATGGDGVQSIFGYSFLSISTPSMEPVYPVGTVVLTRKADPNALKTGDVISFYSQDPVIQNLPNTHRIIAIEKMPDSKLQFVTKGDNNAAPDSYLVKSDRIIGVVTGSVKSVGKVINILKNRYVLFVVFIIPLFVIVVKEVANIGKIINKKYDIIENEHSDKDNTEVKP